MDDGVFTPTSGVAVSAAVSVEDDCLDGSKTSANVPAFSVPWMRLAMRGLGVARLGRDAARGEFSGTVF